MQNGWLKIFLFLSLFSGGAAAETVYVHDQLRLGVRAAPNAAEKSIAVVKTGDALSVLGEQDDFINIRTEAGLEGWVSKGYVSTEPPAQNLLKAAQQELEALQQQHHKLKQQLDKLTVQLAERDKESQQQQNRFAQLQHDNTELQRQLGLKDAVETNWYEKYSDLIWLALLMGCFLTGWIIGVRWKARRVAERIGGLEI